MIIPHCTSPMLPLFATGESRNGGSVIDTDINSFVWAQYISGIGDPSVPLTSNDELAGSFSPIIIKLQSVEAPTL